MVRKYNVSWSRESKTQTDSIYKFLKEKWEEDKAKEFIDLLFHFEKIIEQFPKSFQESNKYKNCRLGFVHKYTTAIYKIVKKEVIVLTVFDNRSQPINR